VVPESTTTRPILVILHPFFYRYAFYSSHRRFNRQFRSRDAFACRAIYALLTKMILELKDVKEELQAARRHKAQLIGLISAIRIIRTDGSFIL
jgi:hypothetical protein